MVSTILSEVVNKNNNPSKFSHHLISSGLIAALALMTGACSTGGSSSTSSPVATPTPPPSNPTPPPAPMPPPVNFDTAEYRQNPGLNQVNALAAYDEGADGSGALVALIDTGIDIDNPEFEGRIDPRSEDLVKPGVADAADLRPGGPQLQDQDGHGTAMAGIVAAARDDSLVHGVAPEADLLIFRADDENDPELFIGPAITEGLLLSAQYGADVLNMSFGTNEPGARSDFQTIFDFTSQEDIVVAISAGNDGTTDPDDSAIAAIDPEARGTVIVVGSVDDSNNISSFSARAGVAREFYLVAPGEDVPTILVDPQPNTIALVTGTSPATAYVSGAAALIRGLWPQLSAQEVVEILLDTATDLGAPGTDVIFGRGLLNIGEALQPQGGVTTSSVDGASITLPIMQGGAPSAQSAFISSPVFGGVRPDLGGFAFVDAYGRDYTSSFDAFVTGPGALSFDPIATQRPFQHIHSHASSFVGGKLHLRLEREDIAFTDSDAALRVNAGEGAYRGGQNDFATDINGADAEENISFAFSQTLASETTYLVSKGYAPREADRLAGLAVGRSIPRARSLSRDGFSDGYLASTQDAISSLIQWRTNEPLMFDVFAVQALDGLGSNLRAGATRRFNNGHMRLEVGALMERDAILGAQLGDLLSEGGVARTAYFSFSGAGDLPFGWVGRGRVAVGSTDLSADGGLVQGVQDVHTVQAAFGLTRQGVFATSDQISFSISHPLQAVSGQLTVLAPSAFDSVNEEFLFEERSAGLTAHRRNIDLEAAYILGDVFGGVIELNLIHQWDPDIYTKRSLGALVRGGFAF